VSDLELARHKLLVAAQSLAQRRHGHKRSGSHKLLCLNMRVNILTRDYSPRNREIDLPLTAPPCTKCATWFVLKTVPGPTG